ncbi:MAG: VOC family protein [Cytophagaceae bacterium]|nr:VOC family protein [Cytophagaceae bacterium]MBP6093521.1 VOC family protein [Cytophagaceae bacterium]
MEMKIDFIHRIQHIGIPAHDLEVSIPFYERLGFENVMEAPFEFDGGYGTCVMMKNHEVIVELYQMPAKQLAEIKSRSNGHVDHFAIDVADVDHAFETLKKAGFEILESTPTFLQFWKNGTRFFNVKGPSGEIIEFNQIL